MNRRDFLKTSAITAGTMMFSNQIAGNAYAACKDKINILWLIAEDLCPDIACYGNKIVKTPNIDRLADQGARCTNAFTTAPVCSPSRSAFMTAMYQTSIGAHNHRSHREDNYKLPEPVKLITEYFRRAGYYTSNTRYPNLTKGKGKTDFNFDVEKPFDGTDWREHKPGQPFFSIVNFKETHRAFKRDPDNPVDPDKIELPPYYPDHPVTRRDWADYLECVQVLDKHVGNVLRRLENDGLTDSTIVFFFGDNGRPHVRGKQFLYDGGIHIPLIIRWPGHIKPATVVDDLVSAIDFAPACLKMVGIEPPGHMQGQVFIGPDSKKRDYIFAARDRCDGVYDRIRCVRDRRFKYIRNYDAEKPYMQFGRYKLYQYPVWTLLKVLDKQGKLTKEQARFTARFKDPEELYDLQNDPHEVNNLARSEKFKPILERMRTVLDEWISQTGDRGDEPELGSDSTAEIYKKRVEKYAPLWKQRGFNPDTPPEQCLKLWEKHLGLTTH